MWAVGDYDTGSGYHPLLLHWNGAAWSVVPEPNVTVSPVVGIQDVAVISASNVWVVGTHLVGSSAQSLVLHWDGTAWSVVTTPTLPSRNGLNRLAVLSTSDIWAVGNIGTTSPLFLHWDGTVWAQFSNPPSIPGVLNSVSALSANDIWAVGYRTDGSGLTLTIHFDGTSWSVVDTAQATNAHRLFEVQAISANDVWALTDTIANTNRFLHWDGTNWGFVNDAATLPSVSNNIEAFDAVTASDIWAVGSAYNLSTHYSATFTEHFSNTCPPSTSTPTPSNTLTSTPTRTATSTPCSLDWRLLASDTILGGRLYKLNDVDVWRPDDAWVVGSYLDQSTGRVWPWTEHWDGSAWIATRPNPDFSRTSAELKAVARRFDEAWAAGVECDGGSCGAMVYYGQPGHLGFIWSRLTNVDSAHLDPNGIADMGISQNHIWVVGSTAGSLSQPFILDGGHLGGNFTRYPITLPGGGYHLKGVAVLSDSDAWAVGDKDSTTPLLLHWDGTGWTQSQVGSAAPGSTPQAVLNSISVLTVPHIDMWAVGNYTDGTSKGFVLHYDGSQWQEVTLPPGTPGRLFHVQVMFSHEVWASYGPLASAFLHWDGFNWNVVAGPNQPPGSTYDIRALGTSPAGELWAVGADFTLGLQDRRALMARYAPTANPFTHRHAYYSRAHRHLAPTNYTIIQMTGTVVPGTTDTGNHCDNCVTSLALPFAYTLYDLQFSSLQVGSNGTIGFAANVNAPFNACVPSAAFNFGIVPYWDDLVTAGTCGTGPCGIFTSISGAVPNRIFNIEWRTRRAGGAIPLDFEVRLYEGSGRFDLIYQRIDPAATESIGVQRDTGSLFTSVLCRLQNGNTGDGTDGGFIIDDGTLLRFVGQDNGPSPTATPCLISFSDVPEGSTFYPYIRCLACRGVVSGYSDGTFRPGNNVTRGQLAKMVANAVGLNDDPGAPMFEDVQPGSTFYDFVQRLAARGYVGGYPCGGPGEPCGSGSLAYFRPDGTATRGQTAKIISNAATFEDEPTGQTFEDVPSDATFYLWVERLSARGIVGGYPCGPIGEPCVPPLNRPYFRPSNNVTRGQSAKMVANTFNPTCYTPAQ